mgnify:CR=1 FL=1
MPRSALHRAALRTAVIIPLLKLNRNARRKFDVLESAIDTLQQERARALKHGAAAFAGVLDASLFVTLLSFDLTVLTLDHAQELRESRQNFYSRQLCMLLFEALEDLPSVFGKEFREALRAITDHPRVRDQLNGHMKSIDVLRRSYSAELKEIRLFAAAHREQDAFRQLEVIRKVDDRRVGRIARELDAILHEIINWLIGVAKLMGDFRVILKNIKIPA